MVFSGGIQRDQWHEMGWSDTVLHELFSIKRKILFIINFISLKFLFFFRVILQCFKIIFLFRIEVLFDFQLFQSSFNKKYKNSEWNIDIYSIIISERKITEEWIFQVRYENSRVNTKTKWRTGFILITIMV